MEGTAGGIISGQSAMGTTPAWGSLGRILRFRVGLPPPSLPLCQLAQAPQELTTAPQSWGASLGGRCV